MPQPTSTTSSMSYSFPVGGNYQVVVVVTDSAGCRCDTGSASTWVSVSDFSLLANVTSFSMSQGSTKGPLITVGSINGFSGTVTLSTVTSSGSFTVFTPSTNLAVQAGGTNTLVDTIGAYCETNTGSYNLTVTGTFGSLSRRLIIPFSVTAYPPTSGCGGGGGGSVAYGTPITMSDGSKLPVQDLQVGDKML